MSDLLDKALERVRAWPKARQEDLARMALEMDDQGVAPYVLDEDERRVLAAEWLNSEAGDFATEDEIRAAFRKFGP